MCALAQPCTQAIPCFTTHLHYMHNTGTCIVNPLSSKKGPTTKFSLLLGFWPAHCLAMSVYTCSASYPGHPIFTLPGYEATHYYHADIKAVKF